MLKANVLGFIFIFLVSCVSTRYASNYEKSVDFESFRTFACGVCNSEFNKQNYKYYNPEIRDRLSEIVRSEMEELGYVYDENSPDLYYDFLISVKDYVDTVSQDTGNPNYRWKEFEQDKFSYKEGYLILNLVEAESGKLIWQAKAQKQLDRKPKNFDSKAVKIVDRMFTYFPTVLESQTNQ